MNAWPTHKLLCKPPSSAAILNPTPRAELIALMDEQLTGRTLPPVVTIEDVNGHVECVNSLRKLYSELKGIAPDDEMDTLIDEMNYHGSKDPLPIKHCDIVAAPSKLHGTGVFATKSIPANVVVTFYPCEATHNLKTGILAVFPFQDELDLVIGQDTAIFEDYKFGLRVEEDDLTIIGNPRRFTNPLLLGHLVNDGATEVFGNVAPYQFEHNRQLLYTLSVNYATQTAKARNCTFKSNTTKTLLSIITTRPIEAGEELLVSYGTTYWLEHQFGYDYKEKYPFMSEYLSNMPLEELKKLILL